MVYVVHHMRRIRSDRGCMPTVLAFLLLTNPCKGPDEIMILHDK
jgi:hypothetical protein